MKRINIENTSFEELIKSDSLYVDKTKYCYNRITKHEGYDFFSCPEGYGKSLMISTFKAIFEGRRDLFKGLYIDNTDYDWKKYPIVYLDYGSLKATTADEVAVGINNMLRDVASEFNVAIGSDRDGSYSTNMIKLLESLGDAIVLIDGYDKVLFANIGNPDLERIRYTILHSLVVLKSCNPYVRFTLVTGVSTYSLVTAYSSANIFYDIDRYSNEDSRLCGYTIEEIQEYFAEYIDLAIKKMNISREEYIEKIKEHFKGYSYSDNAVCRFLYDEEPLVTYSPLSINRFFAEGGCNFDFVEAETHEGGFLLHEFRELDAIWWAKRDAELSK